MLNKFLNAQFAGEEQLPHYGYHVSDNVVTLDDGRLVLVVRCSGLPFEVISDNLLENQYDSLNNLLLSLAKSSGGRLGLWCHIDHYQTEFKDIYSFQQQWVQEFSNNYMAQFRNAAMYENYFYLSFLLKPDLNANFDDCLRELEDISLTVTQTLAQYECEVLSSYEFNGNLFSQVYEFIAYLYNGFYERVPVTSLPLYQAVQTSTLFHGYKLIETRFPDGGNRFSALFDLKDFPEPSTKGKFNPLLEAAFPFIVCLSFTLIDPGAAIKAINSALNKLESAGDEAFAQQADMVAGKGALMAGDVYFGEFHGAVAVFGQSEKEVENRGASLRATFSSSCATQVVPATMSAPETFFSMFPGNVKRRPRPMPKTTRNLLALFSMGTYSSGKQRGNPVGDGSAVIPLTTTAKGVYHFNFHFSLPGQHSVGDKVAGHTMVLGATGTGKTTAQTTLLTFISRFGCKLFAVDKDGSMRGFVEGMGGTYFKLSNGDPTGLNPFQLADTPPNRAFLYDLVAACGRSKDREATAEDTRDIKRAVDNVFELPFHQRRFGVVVQSVPDHGENCLARRLQSWCYGETDGRYAYALDNETNAFNLESFTAVGFDVTDFLVAGHPATEPILACLFHFKSLMQLGGGLLATVVEEFWLPLKYPTTANQIRDIFKTGRRRGEFIVLVSQSPEDVIFSELLPEILQQTSTLILLPNPEAEFTNADGGGYSRLGVSAKEFKKLKALGQLSRMFLVKQGSQSSIVRLDLSGMGDDIAVLAMDGEDFEYLDAAKVEAGSDPDNWVPLYKRLRKAGKAKKQLRPNGSNVSFSSSSITTEEV